MALAGVAAPAPDAKGAGAQAAGARALSTRFPRLPSAATLARGAAAEVVAQLDRVFLWVPVAFGLGAAVYLGLKTEPLLWPTALVAIVLGVGLQPQPAEALEDRLHRLRG